MIHTAFEKVFLDNFVEIGNKNCFSWELPLHLPGNKKPLLLHFQRRDDDSFECSENGVVAKKIRPYLNHPRYQEVLADIFFYNCVELKDNKLISTIYIGTETSRIFWNYIQAIVQLNAFTILWRDKNE